MQASFYTQIRELGEGTYGSLFYINIKKYKNYKYYSHSVI
jgi:hypothetical protein